MNIEERIEVKAKTEEQALKKAYSSLKEMVDESFSKDDISLELIKEEKKLFGLMKGDKVYQALLRLEEKIDGSFKVEIDDDGIFLTVNQAQGRGREIRMDMVEEVLEEKEIVEVDYTAVSEALITDGERVKIAERRPELDRDSEVEFNVSSDKMEVYMNYKPALGGKELTVRDIITKLNEMGIIFGIKKEELKEEFNAKKELNQFLVAQGEEPTEGEDGKIELQFDPEQTEKKVNISEDGNADFYNLNRIINVKSDDLLAIKVPAQEGENGTNVKGEEVLPLPIKEAELPIGDNVRVNKARDKLFAEMEGQVVYNRKSISVLDVYTVQGDVDLSTGNIDFNGNVTITGDVKDGMEVEAAGNVIVQGNVSGGKVEAEGQIIVNKGFVGRNKGWLKATGDIETKFIENGTVETKGDLIVKDAIMHSKIDAGRKVILNQNKGLIVGGKVRAGMEIDAKVIGSSLATPPDVCVGVTPELRDDFREKNEIFKDAQEKMDKIIKDINLLKKRRDKKGSLSENRQNLLNQLIRQRYSYVKKLETVKKERDEIKDELQNSKRGRIKIKGTLYSGVTVVIGTCIERIQNKEEFIQYYVNDADIKSVPYS